MRVKMWNIQTCIIFEEKSMTEPRSSGEIVFHLCCSLTSDITNKQSKQIPVEFYIEFMYTSCTTSFLDLVFQSFVLLSENHRSLNESEKDIYRASSCVPTHFLGPVLEQLFFELIAVKLWNIENTWELIAPTVSCGKEMFKRSGLARILLRA